MDSDGRERVIAYGSRLLSKPERQYCVIRRELLAVVKFTQHYRPYLIAQKFTLRTDHGSLVWLRILKELEGQLARWLERLQELNFDVVHRRGTAHGNADSLSRLPFRQCCRVCHDTSTTAEIAVTTLQLLGTQTRDSLRQAQLADPMDGSPRRLQTVIPEALQREVLSDLHEGAMGGHLGADKTLGRLKERFYWPGHYNAGRDWCPNCGICASRKTPTPKGRAPLKPLVTSYPLQLVAMDIVGPFPESVAGNSYILVVASPSSARQGGWH